MNKRLIFLPLFFFVCHILLANPSKIIHLDSSRFPEIEELKSTDILFKEFCFIVEDNYKLIAADKEPQLLFFKYIVKDDLNLLGLSARCNIPYETIATLNSIFSTTENLENKVVFLPTVPGIFIKKDGKTTFEVLLYQNAKENNLTNKNLCYKINGVSFEFLQNQRLSSTERAYFLDSALGLPLAKGDFWVSSEFGKRKNPFSGEWKNHNGIDFAANEGTPVYAVKDGKVALCKKNDNIFGNYIILEHDDGSMTSVYAHLYKMNVHQSKIVKKGEIIGFVGQSGMVTGAHLHFEIRKGGIPMDPQKKLKL